MVDAGFMLTSSRHARIVRDCDLGLVGTRISVTEMLIESLLMPLRLIAWSTDVGSRMEAWLCDCAAT
jgi:hypothetical protein